MQKLCTIAVMLALAACSTAPIPISPATQATVLALASDAAAVQSACAEALPLASLAAIIPVVGAYVAAGVQVGCDTANGVAKLTADPSSAAWLGEQIQMLKQAMGKT